jgi:nitrogen-specific signal transduction histidine kinase
MAKFAVRARAVDMLGRQQIAGIPTAIHELFKNAHDAYATRVEVDYLRDLNRLVVRDNGLGMTESDFRDRWLALGTESKFGANADTLAKWTGPEELPVRPLMGEKGIGRLAIATIAPVTFVLSRAVRPDGLHALTGCLVCWPLFELPGLDISDIEIPLRTFENYPNGADIEVMVEEIKANIETIVDKLDVRHRLLQLMEDCDFDPVETDDWFAQVAEEIGEDNLTLTEAQYGTHFYLFECDESLLHDIGDQGSDETETELASPIKRMLLGFGNTMSSDRAPPVRAEFRDHKPTGNFDELIGGDEFFSADDLQSGDHYFEGQFDEFGQFRGTLQIYRNEPMELTISWPDAKGQPVACGPFELRLGMIQGLPEESLLAPEEYQRIDAKMRRFGGLYVYRDGIRILPYGMPDFDWLGIEFRRTKSARDWFFSHRRMAGYVALNRQENWALTEKAGREGFRQNRAYRDMQAILENWFQQVAKDFFRKQSERSPIYREILDSKRREAEQLRKRKEKVQDLKAQFRNELDVHLDKAESREYDSVLDKFLEEALERFERGRNSITPQMKLEQRQALSTEVLAIEDRAVAMIGGLTRSLQMSLPRNFAPTKSDKSSYESYLDWLGGFRDRKVEPAIARIRTVSSELREQLGVRVSRSDRARNAIESESRRVESYVSKLVSQIRSESTSFKEAIDRRTKDLRKEFLDGMESLQSDLQRQNLDEMSDEAATEIQRGIERKLDRLFDAACCELQAMLDQLRGASEDIRRESLPDETIAALEGRVGELEEQLTFYNDLAQAGSAVSILGHELENVVSGLRAAIRDIKPWADGTPELNEVYERLRTYYDHIDSYVGLFSPLTRRVRRKRVNVTGASILAYVQELFDERFERSGIDLRVSDAFRKWSVSSYRSTLIAAVVNIVDNAVYWIGSDRHSEPWIEFDTHEDGIVIRNGGPGVPRRAARMIFEYGMSNKPGGRGMGLAISREALASVGLKLELLEEGTETRPAFAISPDNGDEDDD